METLPEAPKEIRKKRKYQYSSRQKAKINANRSVIKAANEAKKVDKAKAKLERKKIAAAKFVQSIDGKLQEGVITGEQFKDFTPTAKKHFEEADVIFTSNPGKQTEFLAASEKEVLYGGAAGGGKSYAMLIDPLRDCDNGNHRAILVRKSMPELQELIDVSRTLYKQAFPGTVWSQRESRWKFPSGAIIYMSFVENDADVHRYQGKAFSWIGIDELTHYATPYVWNYLRSRLRTTDPTLKTYMRATTNPGGIGGWWVKKMFIDPAPYGEAFWAKDIETGEILVYPNNEFVPKELRGKPLFKRRFIPANLSDNPYLMQSAEYLAMLSSLPEVQRRRLLEGDWNVAEDTAFPEFDFQTHTCAPFEIPNDWHRFRSCDYGYVAPSAVLWYAVSPTGIIYVYRELYEKRLDAEDLAARIIELEWDDPGVLTGPLDTESWSERGNIGPSVAETMIREGVRWVKTDKSKGSRKRGKNEIHKRLKKDPYNDDKPGVIIFRSCRNLIRVIPILPLDEKNMEDVDTKFVEDHLYDSWRYGLNSRPTYSLYPDEKRYVQQAERPGMVDTKFGY